MKTRDARRLEDIIRAIDSIQTYCPATKEELKSEEPLLSHVVLKLMHVGEAASGLDEAVRADAPEVPWSDIIGMRNILPLRERVSALHRRLRDSSDQPPASP